MKKIWGSNLITYDNLKILEYAFYYFYVAECEPSHREKFFFLALLEAVQKTACCQWKSLQYLFVA